MKYKPETTLKYFKLIMFLVKQNINLSLMYCTFIEAVQSPMQENYKFTILFLQQTYYYSVNQNIGTV